MPMKRQWGAVILESLAFHGLGRIGVRPSLSSRVLNPYRHWNSFRTKTTYIQTLSTPLKPLAL
jgi:hypothetical protein